ncbi:MAG: hypothetical protein R2799_04785 [Crocinitomicaceae bacterium]
MRLIKSLILFLILFNFTEGISQTQKIKEAKIKFDLPNDKWSLADQKSMEGLSLYVFKREGLLDSDGREVISNIAVIIEHAPDTLGVVEFSLFKRMQVPIQIEKVLTSMDEQPLLHFVNAIGYKGSYTDENELAHTVYIVHLINENKGVQIIMDITSNLFGVIEEEFLETLKSIK